MIKNWNEKDGSLWTYELQDGKPVKRQLASAPDYDAIEAFIEKLDDMAKELEEAIPFSLSNVSYRGWSDALNHVRLLRATADTITSHLNEFKSRLPK